MDYIDAEYFINQPEKVQEVLRKWYNNYYKQYNARKNIPLFKETELRKFIAEHGEIEVIQGEDKVYGVAVYINYSFKYHSESKDLLQAYWKVACKIAQKEIEKEGR